jgi:hypothetical protein
MLREEIPHFGIVTGRPFMPQPEGQNRAACGNKTKIERGGMHRGILLRVSFDCRSQRPFELSHCLVSINGVLGQCFEAHEGELVPDAFVRPDRFQAQPDIALAIPEEHNAVLRSGSGLPLGNFRLWPMTSQANGAYRGRINRDGNQIGVGIDSRPFVSA